MNQPESAMRSLVKTRFYLDSVALMRMSAALCKLPGVRDAAMMMATPANHDIMANAGLLEDSARNAGPADLVIGIRADNDSLLDKAFEEASAMLVQPAKKGTAESWKPRSIRAAVETQSDANLAIVSVPGAFACSEARKAIRNGLHVMIFSDNVPLQEEVELKQEARDLNRLVMGPDCGTAILHGTPLAFANALPRGDVGIVGASGTGIQEVTCLLARAGIGISHAIGVGGRDLHNDVGGISTLMALDALDKDPVTTQIVVISKPPSSTVAAKVIERISRSPKSVTLCFVGGDKPDLPADIRWAQTLAETAAIVIDASNVDRAGKDQAVPELASAQTYLQATDGSALDAIRSRLQQRQPAKHLRGLFCGGTLCAEAQIQLLSCGLTPSSNASVPGAVSGIDAAGHTLIDLGADEYTLGRPHPMIEPAVRDEPLMQALQDHSTGVVLLDCVIGFGAHANPAGEIVRVLQQSGQRQSIPIVASITGTEQDPQIRSQQQALLESAGVQVATSNASATLDALMLLE